jgi:hypothetical protein
MGCGRKKKDREKEIREGVDLAVKTRGNLGQNGRPGDGAVAEILTKRGRGEDETALADLASKMSQAQALRVRDGPAGDAWMDAVIDDQGDDGDGHRGRSRGRSGGHSGGRGREKRRPSPPPHARHVVRGSDFVELFEAEAAGAPAGDGWEAIVDTRPVRLYRRPDVDESQPPHYLLWGRIAAVPEVAFRVLVDNAYRKEWDEYVGNLTPLELDGSWAHGSDAYRLRAEFPYGLTDREYVLYRRTARRPNGDLAVIARSGEHPGASEVEPGVSVVRATIFYSGIVVRADPETPGGTIFFNRWRDSPGGMLPNFVIKWFTTKAIPKYIDQLTDVCAKYFSRTSIFVVPDPPLMLLVGEEGHSGSDTPPRRPRTKRVKKRRRVRVRRPAPAGGDQASVKSRGSRDRSASASSSKSKSKSKSGSGGRSSSSRSRSASRGDDLNPGNFTGGSSTFAPALGTDDSSTSTRDRSRGRHDDDE